MAIILETGINEKQRILDFMEDLSITQENKMKKLRKISNTNTTEEARQY